MNDLSKDAVNRLAVDEAGAGQRVDNFLLRVLKGVPKSHIYRILRSGEVRVNRLRVKPDVRLVLGDELRIPPIRTGVPLAGTRKPPPLSASIPILYEDDALIAVDKPAGLAVHGGSGVAFGLIEQMRAARPTAKFLELVHRLDRDTSGVLLVAKKRAALVGLHAALRQGRVDKRYQILVKGQWRDAKREVTLPLTKYLTSTGERRVRVEQVGGQAAKTVFYRRRVWTDIDPPVSLLLSGHMNGVIQLEGAWIKRTFAQGGELRVAIFEAPDVRREDCRAALRFQVTMAFGAPPLAGRAYVYAAAVFAVARGAFEGFDLIGVMDRAIVATQARLVRGLCGKRARLRHMARCALVFEDGVCRGHTTAAINA